MSVASPGGMAAGYSYTIFLCALCVNLFFLDEIIGR